MMKGTERMLRTTGCWHMKCYSDSVNVAIYSIARFCTYRCKQITVSSFTKSSALVHVPQVNCEGAAGSPKGVRQHGLVIPNLPSGLGRVLLSEVSS